MFLLATKVAVYQKVVSNVEEVKARGGRVLAVVTEGDSGLAKLADHKIEVPETLDLLDRKSTRLNSSHTVISYAVFCLKKKKVRRAQDRRDGGRKRSRVG